MLAQLFIGEEITGEVDFSVIDAGMGVIGGCLMPNENYQKFQPLIQAQFERSGISNSHDFNFIIRLDSIQLFPAGGIGITDSKDFNEIYVEAAGIDQTIMEKFGLAD